jgi:hypothetical protein
MPRVIMRIGLTPFPCMVSPAVQRTAESSRELPEELSILSRPDPNRRSRHHRFFIPHSIDEEPEQTGQIVSRFMEAVKSCLAHSAILPFTVRMARRMGRLSSYPSTKVVLSGERV